ncbi:MAG: hypothetical protein AAGC71_11605 [Pseudomonadota bacterium]
MSLRATVVVCVAFFIASNSGADEVAPTVCTVADPITTADVPIVASTEALLTDLNPTGQELTLPTEVVGGLLVAFATVTAFSLIPIVRRTIGPKPFLFTTLALAVVLALSASAWRLQVQFEAEGPSLLDRAAKYRKFTSLGDGVLWDSNPFAITADNAASEWIVTALRDGDVELALAVADKYRSPAVRPHRAAAYLIGAIESVRLQNVGRAKRLVVKSIKAHRGTSLDRMTAEVVALAAVTAAEAGDIESANALSDELSALPSLRARPVLNAAHVAAKGVFKLEQPQRKNKDLRAIVGAAIVRANALSLGKIGDRATPSQWQAALAQSEQFLGIAAKWPSAATQQLQCDTASLAVLVGSLHLRHGELTDAIKTLGRAEVLDPGDDVAPTLLSSAYELRADSHIGNYQFGSAIADLEAARARSPANAVLNCRLSDVHLYQATRQAARGDFNAVGKSTRVAQWLCPDDVNKGLIARTSLMEAEHHLRYGRWSDARSKLQHARRDGDAETQQLVGTLTSTLRNASHHLENIHRVSRWIKGVPSVTGFACTAQVNGICTDYVIYNGTQAIGGAGTNLNAVGLQSSAEQSVYLDKGAKKHYEVVQFVNTRSEHTTVFYETDGDSRVDGKDEYKKGRLVATKKYSAKISLRIVGAAIASRRFDFWGDSPDPYLNVGKTPYKQRWQNLGWTRTIKNTQFPSWSYDAFSVDLRYGDCVNATMFDHDRYNADDRIDKWEWCEIPTNGEYIGRYGNAVVELLVRPTRRPEGHFIVEGDELPNVFRAPSRRQDPGDIADIIRAAHRSKERAAQTTEFVAVVLPEAVIQATLRRANLLAQIGLGWLGYEVISNDLASSDP